MSLEAFENGRFNKLYIGKLRHLDIFTLTESPSILTLNIIVRIVNGKDVSFLEDGQDCPIK